MSFRARLITFFLLIVMVPMFAVGFLVLRLIQDSGAGKAQARVNGLASAAASVYAQASRSASYDARTVARLLESVPDRGLRARVRQLDRQVGIARVVVSEGGRPLVDVGDRTAVSPGLAVVAAGHGHRTRTVIISELSAAQYAGQLHGRGFGVVLRQSGQTLASTVPGVRDRVLPRHGNITLGATTYQAVTLSLPGFEGRHVGVTVLSDGALTRTSIGTDRLVAILFIIGFFGLALAFALYVTRDLQHQLAQFLRAAQRLAKGDFSSPVPVHGKDEFAALGVEFNAMSAQLRERLQDLEREQARVRRSIRNIGEAFASNLDRDGLLELALRTAMDATDADRGRLSARDQPDLPLTEAAHVGRLDGLQEIVLESERRALEGDGLGQASGAGIFGASVALGAMRPGLASHGVITVLRTGRAFSEDDLALLRQLALRATLALDNVQEHFDVQRAAITDDLTGLATHGRFQELLALEIEEAHRYSYPVGLVMLDIDNFKSINDRYGHQQGDRVLRCVSAILRDTSRDVDVAARYGGEEMCLILPHTDLEGTYVIAERVREAIAAEAVPLADSDETIRVTASFGVAAATAGSKNALIAAADGALYRAKHEGKNRTVKAPQPVIDEDARVPEVSEAEA
ncbi:MAG TPA: diguanylate cyclase [Solirubrobacteraceae bacterium]|nr:diguanylate cyclase [Solirubrobacteraceae bacterium]